MSSYFYISEEIIPYLIRNAISFMYGHSGENLERIILIFQMTLKLYHYKPHWFWKSDYYELDMVKSHLFSKCVQLFPGKCEVVPVFSYFLLCSFIKVKMESWTEL